MICVRLILGITHLTTLTGITTLDYIIILVISYLLQSILKLENTSHYIYFIIISKARLSFHSGLAVVQLLPREEGRRARHGGKS